MALDDAEAHIAAQEAQLVGQIADGNIEEPMAELYRRYAKNLYRFGLHMLGDEGLAEEMVQESFQRLWRSAGRYDAGRGSVGVFLFVIARSAAADIRKRPSSRPLLDSGDAPAVADSPGMVDDALEGVEYRESLKPLLEQLPPREKKILLLRFFGNMTQLQIAAELGISQGRVSRLLDRTLAQLREGLSEESTEGAERESTNRAESSLYPDDSLGVALIDNELRLITVQADGKVEFLDPRNNSHHLLYLVSLVTYGWKSLIEELEDLINTPQVNESQLQEFFESNPEFLCGDTYESAKSHIILQRPDAGPLIPDFALKPPNEHALCDLLELKLPSAKLLVGQSNRKRLSAALLEACAQLREYRDYFESRANRQAVEEIYGLRFFRPRMMVIIGKRSEYIAGDLRKAEGDIAGLSITTYDDLLERARSRMRRIKKT